MDVRIGEIIKKTLIARKIKLKDFADDLGMARQNVYRIFEKSSIETGLLVRISSILNYNFFQHFENPGLEVTSDVRIKTNMPASVIEFELEACRNELRVARKEIDYLKRIIDLMEERTTWLSSQVKPVDS